MIKLENKSIRELKKIADRIFSKYIRMSEMDENGYVKCTSCGLTYKWQEIQNGHWIARNSSALRYDERNCNPQCVNCNMWKEGNLQAYAVGLQNKYGWDILLKLDKLKREKKGFAKYELIEMINKYKKRIKEINEKNKM